jgi:tripartite-type tricarboxylate transporter receptor subunit TctC
MRRRNVLIYIPAGAAALSLGAMTSSVRAQQSPSGKPVLITLGLQAGTGSDIATRAVAERMAALLGITVVIENLPGAGGLLAAAKVATSPADGNALFALSNGTLTVAPNLQKVQYDPFKDLVPVAYISGFPSVLIVNKDFPAKTLREFIAVAKQRAGKVTYGSGGVGSVQHLATESFKASAGIDMLHVPYKGSLQATVDIAGGQIDCMFNGISTVLPYIQSGQVRAIATSGDTRMALNPDIPTVAESGVPGFSYEPWTGLYAPPNTPPAVIARLNEAVRKATASPELKVRWAALGIVGKDMTPDQMARLIRAEDGVNKKVIADKGIKID